MNPYRGSQHAADDGDGVLEQKHLRTLILKPSPEDAQATRQIMGAGKLRSVDALDHLVIGQRRWVSLKELRMGF